MAAQPSAVEHDEPSAHAWADLPIESPRQCMEHHGRVDHLVVSGEFVQLHNPVSHKIKYGNDDEQLLHASSTVHNNHHVLWSTFSSSQRAYASFLLRYQQIHPETVPIFYFQRRFSGATTSSGFPKTRSSRKPLSFLRTTC
jgi:hypothetical protein